MRRGAASTSRALAEQASASEEISTAAAELHRMIATDGEGISEQAPA